MTWFVFVCAGEGGGVRGAANNPTDDRSMNFYQDHTYEFDCNLIFCKLSHVIRIWSNSEENEIRRHVTVNVHPISSVRVSS